MENLTHSNTPTPIHFKQNIQIAVSSCAFLVNILVLLILTIDRNLLKKSAFLFGLNIANLFIASAFTISTAYRMLLTTHGQASVKASVAYCVSTLVPELYYLAYI